MRRRDLLGLVTAAAIQGRDAAWAYEGRRKLGYLHVRSVAPNSPTVAILRPVWERLGYGAPDAVMLRSADNDPARLPALAAEMARLGVGVVIAVGLAAIQAASASGVPVVGIDLETDPVRAGLASSYSRPGGGITGLFLDHPSLTGKWIDLLSELVPGLERIVLAWDSSTREDQLAAAKAAAAERGIAARVLEARTAQAYEEAFQTLSDGPKTGMVQLGSPGFAALAPAVAAIAAARGLPTIAFLRAYAQSGLLMSYGPNQDLYYPRAVMLADRILRGEKAGNLPMEQPAQFQLAINLKTARVLGIAVPFSILARADEVIE